MKILLERALCGVVIDNIKLLWLRLGVKEFLLPFKGDLIDCVSFTMVQSVRLRDTSESSGELMDKQILERGNIPDSPVVRLFP